MTLTIRVYTYWAIFMCQVLFYVHTLSTEMLLMRYNCVCYFAYKMAAKCTYYIIQGPHEGKSIDSIISQFIFAFFNVEQVEFVLWVIHDLRKELR